MSRLLIALLLLLGLLLVGQVWASGEHEPGACPMQSWDNKTGPNEIWWKTVTACNDHPAEELNHSVWLQEFDWNSWTWSEEKMWPIYWEAHDNTDWSAASRYREVEPGGGLKCYRIRTAHFVVEWSKMFVDNKNSYSLGQCY